MLGKFIFRGANIAYSTKGKGRAIVLIHGFLGAKEIWNEYQSRLAKNFQVICIDLPGHGKSACIGYVHNMELLAACVKQLLKQLNKRKAIIIGHSLGGYVGLAFAEMHPEAVLGLILINSTANGDSKAKVSSRNQLIELVKKDKSRAIDLLVPTFFSHKTRKTGWQIKSYLKMAQHCSEQAIIATIEGMKIRKEREILLKFAPFRFHYIISENDSILPSNQLIAETEIGENGSYTIIEDSSHMSIMDKKEQVFRVIKTFSKQ